MKRYRFLEGNTGKTVLALFLLIQLLLARDSLITTCVVGFSVSQLLLAGITGLLGIVFLACNRGQWKQIFLDRRMALAGFAGAAVLLPCLLKQDWQLMYMSILFCVLLGILLTYFTSLEQISRYYVVLMAALGVYSIMATYFLRKIGENGLIPYFYNSVDVKFFNFGLAFVSESYVKNRNFGIFREPGVHQYFLLLALFLNQYHVRWERGAVRWGVGCVLALTMVTTLSTSGVLALMLFGAFLFFDRKLYRSKAAWGVVVTLGLLLAIGLTVVVKRQGDLFWELYAMTVSKFQPGQESLVDRFQTVFVDGMFFLQHPILGAPIAQVLYAVENNTSSTLILLAILGLAGGCVHVAGWVALAWHRERSTIGNFVLLAILFLSFNTQNLVADVFLWLFPTMALVERLMCSGRKGDADGTGAVEKGSADASGDR